MDEESPLIEVSMQIILHAGDARNNAHAAIEAARAGNYDEATEQMNEAQENILLAHQAQTDVLQQEMAGQHYDLCILFIHAQDTLMTIKSELLMAEQIVELQKQLNDLKAGVAA